MLGLLFERRLVRVLILLGWIVSGGLGTWYSFFRYGYDALVAGIRWLDRLSYRSCKVIEHSCALLSPFMIRVAVYDALLILVTVAYRSHNVSTERRSVGKSHPDHPAINF